MKAIGLRLFLAVLSLLGLFGILTLHFWGLLFYAIIFGLWMRFVPDIQERYSNLDSNFFSVVFVFVSVSIGLFTYGWFESDIKSDVIQDFYELAKSKSWAAPVFYTIDFGPRHWVYYVGLFSFYAASVTPLFLKSALVEKKFGYVQRMPKAELALLQRTRLFESLLVTAIFVLPWYFINSDFMYEGTDSRIWMFVLGLWPSLVIWFFAISNAIATTGKAKQYS